MTHTRFKDDTMSSYTLTTARKPVWVLGGPDALDFITATAEHGRAYEADDESRIEKASEDLYSILNIEA